MRATRPIKAGEELTISYIESAEQTRRRRHNILKNQFGFEVTDNSVKDEMIEKLRESVESTPEIVAKIDSFEDRIDVIYQEIKDCTQKDDFTGEFSDDLLPKIIALSGELSEVLDPRHILFLRLNKMLLEALHPKLSEPQSKRTKAKKVAKSNFGDNLVLYLKTAYEVYKTQLLCLSRDHIDFATTYGDMSMAIESLLAWDSQKLFSEFPQWDNFQKATKFQYFCQSSLQKLDEMYK